VDDDVLPCLSLAVDGLNSYEELRESQYKLKPEDVITEGEVEAGTFPESVDNPEPLEVYGWESSLWVKIRRYLGF
jgi:hypothetical protein